MNLKDGVIFAGVLACGLGMTSAANACSTALWSDIDGTVIPGSPVAVPRYSQLCALNVTTTGSVRDKSPEHTRIRVRFYVFSNVTGSGNAVLFRAYSDEADTTLFEIRRSAGNLVFNTAAAGGSSVNVIAPTLAGAAKWTAIEFDWTSGGTMNIWVDAPSSGGTTATVAAGTGIVRSTRLGLITGLQGFAGNVVFDAYEAHSTMPVGLLKVGDANSDLARDVFDLGFVRNEILGNSLATGQPDCNEDGAINVFDLGCVRNIILAGG